jgi:hypothetical protein
MFVAADGVLRPEISKDAVDFPMIAPPVKHRSYRQDQPCARRDRFFPSLKFNHEGYMATAFELL